MCLIKMATCSHYCLVAFIIVGIFCSLFKLYMDFAFQVEVLLVEHGVKEEDLGDCAVFQPQYISNPSKVELCRARLVNGDTLAWAEAKIQALLRQPVAQAQELEPPTRLL